MIVHSSDQSEEFDPLYGEFVSLFFQKEKEWTAAREAADKAREDSEKATKEHEEEVARIQEKIRQLNDKKEKLQVEKREVLEEQNKKEIAKAEKTAKVYQGLLPVSEAGKDRSRRSWQRRLRKHP